MRKLFLAIAILCSLAVSAWAAQPYQLTNNLASVNAQAVIRETDGSVIPPDPGNADYQAYLVWLPCPATGACAPVNTPDPAPTPIVSTVISKSAFLALFTDAELTAISAAARSSDPVNVWLIRAQAADAIDLANPLTKDGLDALVTAGVLTGDRETAILANGAPSP